MKSLVGIAMRAIKISIVPIVNSRNHMLNSQNMRIIWRKIRLFWGGSSLIFPSLAIYSKKLYPNPRYSGSASIKRKAWRKASLNPLTPLLHEATKNLIELSAPSTKFTGSCMGNREARQIRWDWTIQSIESWLLRWSTFKSILLQTSRGVKPSRLDNKMILFLPIAYTLNIQVISKIISDVKVYNMIKEELFFIFL